MKTQTMTINDIPVIIWGADSESVYIYVHGKLSRKEEAKGFAEIATNKGYQVISFDLPEHGERKDKEWKCTVQNGVSDLKEIGDFVENKWKMISLCGISIGAFFSLIAYRNYSFQKSLFLSPVLDMERLIKNMMKWSNVSEEILNEKQEIETTMGETLSWPYYEYVKENPITRWENDTYILMGSKDTLNDNDVVSKFIKDFKCNLDIYEGGEHYFHTEDQMIYFNNWLRKNL